MPSKTLCSFIVCDFETSGLVSTKNAITEVAMIALRGDTLQEIGRYEAYAAYNYDPSLVYEEKALSVTGITIEDLIEKGIPIKQLVDGMIDLFERGIKSCEGKYAKNILVGHNFGFDASFLVAIFNFCKKDLSKYVTGKKDHYGNFSPDYIDTLFQARMKFQDDDTMLDFKLGTFVEKVGLDLVDAHRAMNDVIANKDAFISIINDLRVDIHLQFKARKQGLEITFKCKFMKLLIFFYIVQLIVVIFAFFIHIINTERYNPFLDEDDRLIIFESKKSFFISFIPFFYIRYMINIIRAIWNTIKNMDKKEGKYENRN